MHQTFFSFVFITNLQSPRSGAVDEVRNQTLFSALRHLLASWKKTSRWTITIQFPIWWTRMHSSATIGTKARRWAGWVIVKNYHQRIHTLLYFPMCVYFKIQFNKIKHRCMQQGLSSTSYALVAVTRLGLQKWTAVMASSFMELNVY